MIDAFSSLRMAGHTTLTCLVLIVIHLRSIYSGKESGILVVLVGGQASLPCNVSRPNSDDILAAVMWYHGENRNPIYTIDARTGKLDKMRHFSSENLRNRAFFNLTYPISHLQISPVSDQDDGEYRCRVDFKRGRTMNRAFHLNVIVPSSQVLLYDHQQNAINQIGGPFNEDSRVNLTCRSKGGKPPPKVLWWRGSDLIDDSYHLDHEGSVINVLSVHIRHDDLMSVYSCTASNNNLTAPVMRSFAMDINLKPRETKLISFPKVMNVGVHYEMACETRGSRPSARILWYRNDAQLDSSDDSVSDDGTLSRSYLHFVPSYEDNGKLLVCSAINQRIPSFSLKDTLTLNVQFAPILSLAFGSSIQTEDIMEGSDIYFECNVKANPSISQIGWLLNQKPLQSDSELRIQISNSSMVISQVSRVHSGQYRCWAKNAQGKSHSEAVGLKIRYPPICKSGQRIDYGVAKNEEAVMVCEVDADPSEVTFHWAFNSSENLLSSSTRDSGPSLSQLVASPRSIQLSTEGLKSIANYRPKTAADYGVILCWATSRIGSQSEPCLFYVLPAEPPDPPENCNITNITAHTLTIECNPGYNGGLDQVFHLQVFLLDSVSTSKRLINNLTSTEYPFFVAHALPAGNSFHLVTYASNSRGRSASVAINGNTLVAQRWRTDLFYEKTVVSTSVVLISSSVVILTILITLFTLIMKVRADRKHRKKTRERASRNERLTMANEKELNRCNNIVKPLTLSEMDETYGPDILSHEIGMDNSETNLTSISKDKCPFTHTFTEANFLSNSGRGHGRGHDGYTNDACSCFANHPLDEERSFGFYVSSDNCEKEPKPEMETNQMIYLMKEGINNEMTTETPRHVHQTRVDICYQHQAHHHAFYDSRDSVNEMELKSLPYCVKPDSNGVDPHKESGSQLANAGIEFSPGESNSHNWILIGTSKDHVNTLTSL